jgi:serine/threonine-protein kinase RsbW
MRVELRNCLDEFTPAMARLHQFADSVGLDESDRQAAVLVLDELLCNTISYGYEDSRPDVIVLELDIVDDNLQIRITDAGAAFNPFERADPDLDLPLEQREPGGLGIYLVKKFMDEYSYDYSDGHNIVCLRKKLATSADRNCRPDPA